MKEKIVDLIIEGKGILLTIEIFVCGEFMKTHLYTFAKFFFIIAFFFLVCGCQSDSTQTIEDEPADVDQQDILNMAWDYYLNGEFDPAEFMFRKVIASKKNDKLSQSAYLGLGNVYYYRGIVYLKKKDPKNAEKTFKTAIDYYLWARYLKKDDPDVLIGLAKVYFETARYFFNVNDLVNVKNYSKIGLEMLDEVSKLDINNKTVLRDIFLLRGNFYHYINDLENAINCYEKYLVVANPNSIQSKEIENTIEILRKKIIK